jgi:hypothetical protein
MDQFRNEMLLSSPGNSNANNNSSNNNNNNVSSSLNPNAASYAPELLAGLTAPVAQRMRNSSQPQQQQQSQSQGQQQQSGSGTSRHQVPFESLANPQLQMQMRAAILAAGASLQLQTMQAQAQQQARLQQQQQQQQAAAAAAAFMPPEFQPPSAETLRLLQTALSLNSTSTSAGTAAAAPVSPFASYGNQMMQSVPPPPPQQQPIGPISRTRKDPDQTMTQQQQQQPPPQQQTLDDSKSFPRPIGTERAQKKNPIPPIGSGFNAMTATDLWSLSVDNSSGTGSGGLMAGNPMTGSDSEWLNSQFAPLPPSDPLVSNLLQSSFSNRAYDGLIDPVLDQQFSVSTC